MTPRENVDILEEFILSFAKVIFNKIVRKIRFSAKSAIVIM